MSSKNFQFVSHTSQSQRLYHSQQSRSRCSRILIFSMFKWMLTIWSLVPLPFLNPVCTSGSSQFMYCLKPSLKNFEHYLASMWNECDSVVVWTLFGTACLWDWNKNQFPWDPLNLSFGLSWQNQGTYSGKLKGARGGRRFLENSRERLQGLTKPSVKSLTGKKNRQRYPNHLYS